MNKLLSLLLLALAAVSTQGFAVSSGIPVMGGAVGGTSFSAIFQGGDTDGRNPDFCYRESTEGTGERWACVASRLESTME